MVKPELVEEQPIPLAEVKGELVKIKARDTELSFRSGKCEDYLNDFVSLKPSKAAELYKNIEKLGISRLKNEHIVNIVDLLPQSVDEIRVLFQGSTVSISKKDTESILGIVKDFVK